MKKTLQLAAVLLLGTASLLYAEADNLEWSVDFEAAKKAAAEKELPVFAFFTGSDWCGWCKKLDKEVLSKKAFEEYASSNLILFKADFPSRKKLPDAEVAQNERLAKKYGVRGFPTIMLLDKDGKVLGQTGYRPKGAKPYVKYLKKLISKATK